MPRKSASAYLLYQPLSLSLYMNTVAGSLTQRLNKIDGSYDPDRSLTPLVLKPQLNVVDPDHKIKDGDYSNNLINCKWYIGTDETGTLILPGNTDYVLGNYGELTVKRNVNNVVPEHLFFTCGFLDPRTNRTFEQTFLVTLSTTISEDCNLSLDVDVPHKMVISAFKLHADRTINAQLRNGNTDVPDINATYEWQVYDYTQQAWRTISNDDIFYVNGQSTKSLTVNRHCIDKELIRVVAYPTTMPGNTAEYTIKAFRWYGAWDFRAVISRGKFIRNNTQEVESLCIVETPKGEVANPELYFDIRHLYHTNEVNSIETTIGYGERAVVQASILPKDPNVTPIFPVEINELTALRALTINGKVVTINGKIACMHFPK